MTKRICIAIIILCFIITYCPAYATANTADDGYLILVYMVGSDLESKHELGSEDIVEMTDGITKKDSDSLVVVVRTGGAKKWHKIPVGVSDHTITLENDADYVVGSFYADRSRSAQKPPRNFGESEVLEDFLNTCISSKENRKIGLVLWNHGSGPIGGIGSDELHNNDSLTLNEVEQALANTYDKTGKRLEFVAFDACMMANIETAEMLSPYANYMIASEDIVIGEGMDYIMTMRGLSQDLGMTGAEVGELFTNTYAEYAKNIALNKTCTLSVTDLSKIPSVINALDTLANKMKSDITSSDMDNDYYKALKDLMVARKNTVSFGDDPSKQLYYDLVDIVDLCENLKPLYPKEAQALIEAVNKAVIKNYHGEERPDANGLTLYFPFDGQSDMAANAAKYNKLNFSAPYQSFINKLTSDIFMLDYNDLFADKYISQNNATAEIKLSPEIINIILEAKSFTTSTNPANNSQVYVHAPMICSINPNQTIVSADVPETDLTLNGHHVSFEYMGETPDFWKYMIPVKINGQDANTYIKVDKKSLEGTILQIKESLPQNQRAVSRVDLDMQKGDVITPVFKTLYNGQVSYTAGVPFVLDAAPRIQSKQIAASQANMGFEITDIYNNSYYFYNVNGQTTVIDASAENRPQHWAVSEIQSAVQNELIRDHMLVNEYDAPITRELSSEIAVILFERLTGNTATVPQTNPFNDTDNSEVQKAYQLGIVGGDGQGRFNPRGQMTNEQLLVMFYRTLQKAIPTLNSNATDLEFDDTNEISDWAVDAVSYFVEEGIISEVGNNKFPPKQPATLQQAIVLAQRVYTQFGNRVIQQETSVNSEQEMDGNELPSDLDSTMSLFSNRLYGEIDISYYGDVDINLTGCYIIMEDGSKFVFPDNFILRPDSEVTITSGPSAKDNPPRYLFWSNTKKIYDGNTKGHIYDSQGNEIKRIRSTIIIEAQ